MNSTVGRFVSRDTWAYDFANPVELNRYVYAMGNPVNYVDPSGYTAAEFGLDIKEIAIKAKPSLILLGKRLFIATLRITAAVGRLVGSDLARLLFKFLRLINTATRIYHDVLNYEEVRQKLSMSSEAGDEVNQDNETTSDENADNSAIDPIEIEISRSKYPEAAQHIEEAIQAGHPDVLTIDKDDARKNARRREALSGYPTKEGLDRDEYPPAMFKEGAKRPDGQRASVRYINQHDNRGAGSTLGRLTTGYPNGTRVKIKVGP